MPFISSANLAEQSTDVTYTVGAGGDFATLNDALATLSRKRPKYDATDVTVTLELQAGFIMAEQVLVTGLNFAWVRITSVDAEVTIDRSALTVDFDGRTPAFGAREGGQLPIIGALFTMDASGVAANQDGVYLRENAIANIEPGCGVKNAAAVGLAVREHSFAYARQTIWTGAGSGDPNHNCVHLTNGSANVREADVSGAVSGQGLRATEASRVNAHGIVSNNNARSGLRASTGSVINADGATCTGNGEHGIRADGASTIEAANSDCSNNTSAGLSASEASTILFYSGTATGAGANAIDVSNGSSVDARNAVATGAGNFGCFAIGSSLVDLRDADVSGAATRGVRAQECSFLNVRNANCQKGASPGIQDVEVLLGGHINASGVTGGISQTANTITSDGIIYQ